jgi:hypothetical protein
VPEFGGTWQSIMNGIQVFRHERKEEIVDANEE